MKNQRSYPVEKPVLGPSFYYLLFCLIEDLRKSRFFIRNKQI